MATSAPPVTPAPPSQPRAQLIHIETDRRLGHEWDEWNGRPLPNGGDFSAPAGVFFRYAAGTIALGAAVIWGGLYLLAPRLAGVWAALPQALLIAWGGVTALTWIWLALLAASYYLRVNLLPERLLERGPFLRVMNYTSLVARAFGRRDWVEHAAIDIYNTLAVRRGRKVGKGSSWCLFPAASRRRPSTACWRSRGATTCRCSWRLAGNWPGE